jgi:hypothetical protein
MDLIGFNPLNRRWTYAEDDPHTGDTVIVEKFDKSHALAVRDRSQLLAADKLGRGENIRLGCSIPPYVQVEISEKLGKPVNRIPLDELWAIIRRDYPYLVVNT